jgi:succinate dehydrogenase hydrophobic anchor subunit
MSILKKKRSLEQMAVYTGIVLLFAICAFLYVMMWKDIPPVERMQFSDKTIHEYALNIERGL